MEQAPIAFIEQYYEKRLARRAQYPEVLRFYESHLSSVTGERVLNIGCGPQFYDDLRRFGDIPRIYIGIDINQAAIEFLATSRHPEVFAGRKHAALHRVWTESHCHDIFKFDFEPDSFDTVVSVGFLGIFAEEPFVRATERIRSWLCRGGVLLNLAWCGNYQDAGVLADRLRYQFNHPSNPGPDEIVRWAQRGGLTLLDQDRYEVPDKLAYGWECVHASCFVK